MLSTCRFWNIPGEKKGKKMFLHKAEECKLQIYYLLLYCYSAYCNTEIIFHEISWKFTKMNSLLLDIKCSSTALVQHFSAGNKCTFSNFRSGHYAEWKNTVLVLVALPQPSTIYAVEEWLLSRHAQSCLISHQIVTIHSPSFNFFPQNGPIVCSKRQYLHLPIRVKHLRTQTVENFCFSRK